MLCVTLSSFEKTSVSPFLIVTLVGEKALPFWAMVCSAATAATMPPAMNATTQRLIDVFISISFFWSLTRVSHEPGSWDGSARLFAYWRWPGGSSGRLACSLAILSALGGLADRGADAL